MPSSHIPLHPVQEGVYIEQLVNGTSSKYNIGGYVKLKGKLNAHLLIRAAEIFWFKNDTTRVSFKGNLQTALQSFERHHMPTINQFDYRNKSYAEALEWMQSRMNTAKSLRDEHLEEQALLHINDLEHWYFLAHHHICCDAMAISLRIKHTLDIYEALLNEDNTYIETLNYPSYGDEAIKAEGYFTSNDYAIDEAYWLEKFPTPNNLKHLPRFDSITSDYRAQVELELDADLRAPLEQFCFNSGFSFHHLLISTLLILNNAFPEDGTLALGIPIHNRAYKKQKHMYGMLSSIVPFTTSYNPQETLTQVLGKIKRVQQQDLMHRQYPWSHIMRHHRAEHKRQQALFDIIVNYQPFIAAPALPDLDISFFELSSNYDDHPIRITLCDYGVQQVLTLRVESIFGPENSQKLAESIISFLSRIPENSHRTCDELRGNCALSSILSLSFSDPLTQLPRDKNDNKISGGRTITQHQMHIPQTLRKIMAEVVANEPHSFQSLLTSNWFVFLSKVCLQAKVSSQIVRLDTNADILSTSQLAMTIHETQKLSEVIEAAECFTTTISVLDNETQIIFLDGLEEIPSKLEHTIFADKQLSLCVQNSNDSIKISLVYDTSYSLPKTADKWGGYLLTLLNQTFVNKPKYVSELNLLSEEAQRDLLSIEHASSNTIPSTSLHELFELQASKHPYATAVSSEREHLTYESLDAKSNQLAHFLIKNDISRTKRVAVCLSRDSNLLVTLLAVLKAGAAFIPLDPTYPKERLADILDDAQPDLIIAHTENVALLPFQGSKIVTLNEQPQWQNEPTSKPNLNVSSDVPAYIIFTSGSTGKPKGVVISQGAVTNFMQAIGEKLELDSAVNWLAITTIAFDISILELFGPICFGGKVFIAQKEDALSGHKLTRLMQEQNINYIQATPSSWELITSQNWEGNDALNALSGGEAISENLVSNLLPKVKKLWNCYGPTEATIWSMVKEITNSDPQYCTSLSGSLRNLSHFILDDNMKPVDIGVTGEIYIAGVGLANEYHQRQDLTQERFVNAHLNEAMPMRLYKTGDRARWNTHRELEFVGRTDNQVKIRGHRIELGEVEKHIQSLPEICQVAVLAHNFTPSFKELIAFLSINQNESISNEQLRNKLANKLPDYMLPGRIVELKSMPLTLNGKINRKALPDFIKHEPEAITPLVEPRNTTEQIILEILCTLLGTTHIGVTSTLFDYGWHSINAANAAAQLHDIYQIDVPVQITLIAKNCSEVAEYLYKEYDDKDTVEEISQTYLLIANMSDEDISEHFQAV
ncbi:non-ribosomal peptide synthetase [Shewanella sp.]|uniref:non-ribosomal peptide synthetase n=1 Tax=Shewanella sp. TaxID=50422 RepID=UPI004053EC15